MNRALQRYLDAATGLTTLTKAKAEQIAQQLVRQGEFATDNVGDVVEELLERQRRNRELVTGLVKSETTRLVRAMGLATTAEVERLERRVQDLQRQLARKEPADETLAARPSSGAAKKAARKSARTAAKKAAKKTAKKTAAKKTAAKKTAKSAKKTGGKKTTGGGGSS